MKLIRTEDAVGQVLCHDITQIIPGEFKGARFRKGHIVQPEDIPVLLSIGKENLYVWEKRPGIVHRIDKDTSGLIIAAKNDFAHAALAAQLKDHSLARTYVCIVCGKIKDDSGTIDAPIGRHPADRKKMAVTEKNSRSAVTHWRVLERFSGYTLVECKLETGRTHQIRVHMAYRGHPILGDMVYGHKKPELGQDSQCLHAKELRFVHPRTGQLVTVSCELPDYFTALLEKLRARA